MTARITHGTCASGKVRYRNKRAAQDAIQTRRNRLLAKGLDDRVELRVYRCKGWHGLPGCRGWHWTSHEPWPEDDDQEEASCGD